MVSNNAVLTLLSLCWLTLVSSCSSLFWGSTKRGDVWHKNNNKRGKHQIVLVVDICQQELPTMTVDNNENNIKVKAVLFDLDGTLLDTEALSDKAILQFYRDRGLLGDDLYNDLVENNGSRLPWELKKQLLGLRGSEWGPIAIRYAEQHWNVPPNTVSVDEIWSGWETNLNKLCSEVEACSGATALVAALAKQNIPLAIATSSRQEAVTKKATNHQAIFCHISNIVAGDHPAVKAGKPAPDIYLEAARQVGVPPSQCLAVEDALSGVRAAKAAGCLVVAVPDPRFTAEEKAVFAAESDFVLESLRDFPILDFGLNLEKNYNID